MNTVVLLSGGLDSAVVLATANNVIDTLTVDYGQRHRREIDAAKQIADHYQVPNTLVTVDPRLFIGSALTDPDIDLPDTAASSPDVTYVPARNTVLLALAAARAESIGARRVAIGANADDAGAYPDCRHAYLLAFRDVLQQGTIGHVWIDAPLIYMTKLAVIDAAHRLDVPIELTWSCYVGGEQPCGQCGACQLREQATA